MLLSSCKCRPVVSGSPRGDEMQQAMLKRKGLSRFSGCWVNKIADLVDVPGVGSAVLMKENSSGSGSGLCKVNWQFSIITRMSEKMAPLVSHVFLS